MDLIDYNFIKNFDIHQFSPCCDCKKDKVCGRVDNYYCEEKENFLKYVGTAKRMAEDHLRLLKFIKTKGLEQEAYAFENEELNKSLRKSISDITENLPYTGLAVSELLLKKIKNSSPKEIKTIAELLLNRATNE